MSASLRDARLLTSIALFAGLMALLIVLNIAGALLMRHIPVIAALGACALLTAGCASSGQLGEKALGNLEHCERTYQANVGALGLPGGSLFIRCPPKPFP